MRVHIGEEGGGEGPYWGGGRREERLGEGHIGEEGGGIR